MPGIQRDRGLPKHMEIAESWLTRWGRCLWMWSLGAGGVRWGSRQRLDWFRLLLAKGRVWLLAAQKPVNRLGWWKGKFALFPVPATGRGRVDIHSEADTLPPPPTTTTDSHWGRAFVDGGRGRCRNSTVSSDSHLETDQRWSYQHHLGCFG